MITIDEMRQVLSKYGLPEQAAITVMRFFDDSGDGTIGLEEFKEKVMDQEYGDGADRGATLRGKNVDEVEEGTEAEGVALENMRRKKAREAEVERTVRQFGEVFANKKGRLTQAFRMLDTNFSGSVDKAEFREALSVATHSSDLVLSDDQVGILVEYFFQAGDYAEELDYDKFATLLQKQQDVGTSHVSFDDMRKVARSKTKK